MVRPAFLPPKGHQDPKSVNQISLTDLAKNEPSQPLLEKEVQVRACELYEQRGKGNGFALQDWLPAEAEVLARFSNLYR
jgi:hypothetical protein